MMAGSEMESSVEPVGRGPRGREGGEAGKESGGQESGLLTSRFRFSNMVSSETLDLLDFG